MIGSTLYIPHLSYMSDIVDLPSRIFVGYHYNRIQGNILNKNFVLDCIFCNYGHWLKFVGLILCMNHWNMYNQGNSLCNSHRYLMIYKMDLQECIFLILRNNIVLNMLDIGYYDILSNYYLEFEILNLELYKILSPIEYSSDSISGRYLLNGHIVRMNQALLHRTYY